MVKVAVAEGVAVEVVNGEKPPEIAAAVVRTTR